MSAQKSLPLAAIFLAVLTLSACTAPSDVPAATTTPPAAAEPEPSASPSATPTVEPAPQAQTCDQIITPEYAAKLAADGLVPGETVYFRPIQQQLADAGGTVCHWGKPNTDATVDIVRLVTFDAEQQWQAALAAEGYTRTDDPVPGAYAGPVDPGSGVSPVVVVEARGLTFANAPLFAEKLTPIP